MNKSFKSFDDVVSYDVKLASYRIFDGVLNLIIT